MYRVIISNGENSIAITGNKNFVLSKADGYGLTVNNDIRELGNRDGAIYSSSRLPSRHLSFTLKFDRNGHAQDVRAELKRVIKPNSSLDVYVTTSNDDVVISGRCESLKMTASGATIAIACPNPWFRKNKNTNVLLYGTKPTFHFPTITNEVVFGGANSITLVTVELDSDVECGAFFTVSLAKNTSSFTIYNITADKSFTMSGTFLAGDVFEIDTENKDIRLIRNGAKSNAVRYLTEDSDLFELEIGENLLKFEANGISSTEANVYMNYSEKVAAI